MKIYLSLLVFSISLVAQAKDSDSLKFWVSFKDKSNTPYSINQPEKYLSKKAIERRERFNIEITEQDFPVNPQYIEKIEKLGIKILNRSRWLNGVSILEIDDKKLKKLQGLSFVNTITKVGVYSKKDNSQMDYLMALFMGLGNKTDTTKIDESYYGDGLNQIKMLNGVAMHQKGYTGKGVTIAVLDGGFMNVHKIETFKHLYSNGQILGSWDFVQLDSNVYDDNNHGMNVLSCMAARSPKQMVGTAPDASYWLLRTEDANTEYLIEEYNWASGAEFADSAGADIINSSLGYTTFDDETMNHTYKDLNGKNSVCSQAATIAAQKGIIICNAAGNEGDDDWRYVGVPADADGIISVGGVNPDRSHADFSSYGPTADGRIKPTIAAQGVKAIVASVSDGFYGSQGTSFASPILCGMVACLRQANPNKTVKEIISALEFSASQYHKPDTILGSGIPDIVLANQFLGGDKYFDYKRNQIASPPLPIFANTISFVVFSPKYDNTVVTITDGTGNIVLRESILPNVKSPLGFHKVRLEQAKTLATGVYTCTVKIGDETEVYKLTKE
jgi:subtilisin family serine protease